MVLMQAETTVSTPWTVPVEWASETTRVTGQGDLKLFRACGQWRLGNKYHPSEIAGILPGSQEEHQQITSAGTGSDPYVRQVGD
jgi:hypothetical protein